MVGRRRRSYTKTSVDKLADTIYRIILERNPKLNPQAAAERAVAAAEKHAAKMNKASEIYHIVKKELMINSELGSRLKTGDFGYVRIIVQKVVMWIMKKFEAKGAVLTVNDIKPIIPDAVSVGVLKCGLPEDVVKYVVKRCIELMSDYFTEDAVPELVRIVDEVGVPAQGAGAGAE